MPKRKCVAYTQILHHSMHETRGSCEYKSPSQLGLLLPADPMGNLGQPSLPFLLFVPVMGC